MKAQAKTPIISFHLELGTLKLRHLILLRRLLYFHCIVTKDENDLTKKILYKQLADTTNGDFIEQIKNDHEYLGLKFNLSEIKDTSKDFFKSKIKKIIKKVAFNEYVNEKRNMKKLSKLTYTIHKKQEYIVSNEHTNKQKQIIFSLRTHTFKVKDNLKKLYKEDLVCSLCSTEEETQEHVFTKCKRMRNKLKMEEYMSIFKENNISKEVSALITSIDTEWNQLVELRYD